jgi:hypothetical protein
MSGKIEKRRIVNMRNKIPRILLFVGLLISIWLIAGCSTKDPWQPTGANPVQSPLRLSIQSGPDTSMVVPGNTRVTFTWTASGGTTKIEGYSWYLEPDETAYGEVSQATNATYLSLVGDSAGITYVFHLRVSDGETTVAVTRDFVVSDALMPPNDVTAPALYLDSTLYWLKGAYLATGANVSFNWIASDGHGYNDVISYQYIFTPTAETSGWVNADNITFADVPAANPAVFKVRARDAALNVSEWDSIAFVVRAANILYIDDYQWVDALGNVDVVKEIQQKEFYRAALRGYAFAEWDNDVNGTPELSDLAGISVVIWVADANGASADGTYRLYTDIGAETTNVLTQFIDAGGKLILTGSQILNYLYDTNPPAANHFECRYLGVSDTLVIADIDTTVTPPETTYAESWIYSSGDFSWAIGTGVAGYPDSAKVDPAKVGTQLDYSNGLIYAKAGVIPIYTAGLTTDGEEPGDYGLPCAWVYAPGGTAKTATLAFNTYIFGEEFVRQIFQATLTRFGQ